MSWNPLAPSLLQILHDLAEIQESTVESCGAAQSCHFSLNHLKHQPYQRMYNHIETWCIITLFWKAFLLLLLQVRTTSRENWKHLDIPPSHSAGSMVQFPRQFLDSFACIRPFESRGCVNICWRKQTLPSTVWAAVVPHQPGLRFFCFSRLCVGHSGGFFVGNDNFFCPYFLESYICRPQYEHVWTSPKLPWFVCVWVFLFQRAKFRCESNGGWWLFIFQFNVPSHVHS